MYVCIFMCMHVFVCILMFACTSSYVHVFVDMCIGMCDNAILCKYLLHSRRLEHLLNLIAKVNSTH